MIAQRGSQVRLRRENAHGAANEAALFAGVVARDLRAFEALYRAYHARLTRFLLTVVRSPELVEEVLSDTMMVVWDRADTFTGAAKLQTWVFGIAWRKAIRGAKRTDQPVADPAADTRVSSEAGPDELFGETRLRSTLACAMDTLSADHRAVVDLTYFHEMSYKEIAQIMSCPVDTIKTRMFHARRHLKRQMAGELTDWL